MTSRPFASGLSSLPFVCLTSVEPESEPNPKAVDVILSLLKKALLLCLIYNTHPPQNICICKTAARLPHLPDAQSSCNLWQHRLTRSHYSTCPAATGNRNATVEFYGLRYAKV